MNEIYVVATFGYIRGRHEMGIVLWFSKLEYAEKYLKNAGKPVDGLHYSYEDDPFEHRWSYAVIEKVHEGRSMNEVISWWKAEYSNTEGRLVNVLKINRESDSVLLENTEGMFNFTHIG